MPNNAKMTLEQRRNLIRERIENKRKIHKDFLDKIKANKVVKEVDKESDEESDK